MKTCFGYIRVSTPKQGTGVSLEVQKDDIANAAKQRNLHITEWFVEVETASKAGRPIFNAMSGRLKRGQADALMLHKLDRGSRNMTDWGDVSRLLDQGVEFHIATDPTDFNSRAGRFIADMLAALAADFSRNQREETIKGLRGRLKQGLFPFRPPLGYLSGGRGQPKPPCPDTAPVVARMFELYATGDYSYEALRDESLRLGLRSHNGSKISLHGMEKLLSNPFYHGLIRIERTGEEYPGIHEPIVSKRLFDKVQQIRRYRGSPKVTQHRHLFVGLFRCHLCNAPLVPELQKGRVYYRCQKKSCPMTCIREDRLEAAIIATLASLQLKPHVRQQLVETWEKGTVLQRLIKLRRSLSAKIEEREAKKGRLAVHIETSVGEAAHRISAHRALKLNPKVAKISETDALKGLRFGYQGENAAIGHRASHRWQSNEAIGLLNDFDFLVQSLFAEQANVSLQTHVRKRRNEEFEASETNFEKLKAIWTRVLPKRQLVITGDDISVDAEGVDPYSASQMSDGERAIFYLIGQTLMAAEETLIIVDEPELHVHPSIMSKLWDELEAARPDCSFVFITHDLEFAAQRSAQKFVIRDYRPTPVWEIEEVPSDTGFSEETNTLILGSRKPILFVEGGGASWDAAIYRACYSNWTIIPYGSCEEVLHAVATMRRNASLTRVKCAGIVDADGQTERDVQNLGAAGVSVLPVAEIENLFLLPDVSREVARTDDHNDAEIEVLLSTLATSVIDLAQEPAALEATVLRHCKRRIDAVLKRLEFSAADVDELSGAYTRRTGELNIQAIAEEFRGQVQTAIEAQDIASLAKLYDNKAFIAEAARHLKNKSLGNFKQWIMRALRNNTTPELVNALQRHLPEIEAQ